MSGLMGKVALCFFTFAMGLFVGIASRGSLCGLQNGSEEVAVLEKIENNRTHVPTTLASDEPRGPWQISSGGGKVERPLNEERAAADEHSSKKWVFKRVFGRNPPRCRVQPNETEIDPYKGCPLPGMNNLLYTQVNRWFCAYRDRSYPELRDRSCNKGSGEPYRFSTLLQVNYSKVDREAGICWSDVKKQTPPQRCEWADIPKFYGTDMWWKARSMIDFHPTYYQLAKSFVEQHINGAFISVHMRRGDYYTHCVVIQKRAVPPWITFKGFPALFRGISSCYPKLDEVSAALSAISAATNIRKVFVATNLPAELKNLTTSNLEVITMLDRIFPTGMRILDKVVVEMCVLSMGSHFVFNRYSSFSASVYEMAKIHGRVQNDNVKCF